MFNIHTITTCIINLALFVLIILVIIKYNNPNSRCYNKYQELLMVEGGSIAYASGTTLLYLYLNYQFLAMVDFLSFIGYTLLFIVTCYFI